MAAPAVRPAGAGLLPRVTHLPTLTPRRCVELSWISPSGGKVCWEKACLSWASSMQKDQIADNKHGLLNIMANSVYYFLFYFTLFYFAVLGIEPTAYTPTPFFFF